MKGRFAVLSVAGLLTLGACAEDATEPTMSESATPSLADAKSSAPVGINVVLKGRATKAQMDQLNAIGRVKTTFPQINGLTLEAKANRLADVRRLPFVKGAAIDQEVHIPPPTDLVEVEDFTEGWSTWNQDAIDVTLQPGPSRVVEQTGEGVYVGVLDTGLLSTWPQYFPEERIAEEYAATVVGGGAADRGRVVVLRGEQWANDVCAHGTHVTSTILGFRFPGANFTGTAPRATVIPVRFKAMHSANTVPFGCSWFTSMSVAGLLYYAELKRDELGSAPLVVNNSWGSSVPDPLVEAAVDFALQQGVLLVASAGNRGDAGMGYPGAYRQVISAAASGWVRQWTIGPWWYAADVADPTTASDFYIAEFSSREHAGQDLDVAAPGSWIVGPYQLQRGKTDWFFLSGTSMAAPHVTGTVALLLEENPSLTQAQAEAILESTAISMAAGCRTVIPVPGAPPEEICWGADATGSGLLDADAAVGAVN